jgi:hypothetical protein
VVPLFLVVAAVGLPLLLTVFAGLAVLAGIANAAWLTLKIRRAQAAGAAPER